MNVCEECGDESGQVRMLSSVGAPLCPECVGEYALGAKPATFSGMRVWVTP